MATLNGLHTSQLNDSVYNMPLGGLTRPQLAVRLAREDAERMTPDELFSRLKLLEIRWRDRQQFLESRGYMLRPRLRPNWNPSWRTSGKHPMDCEDSISLPLRPNLVDATRLSDGVLVYIKRVKTGDDESRIACMLSSETLRSDPANHAVPIIDIFQDSEDTSISYIVMPFLLPFDSPNMVVVDEVVDFTEQMLEGLVFLHKCGVAHRDCSNANLMMDGSAMYPRGHHPVNQMFLPDGIHVAPQSARADVPVKYYYVDFGISVHIHPDAQPEFVVGSKGRDQEPPELSDQVPYDPFKLDVFILGNVLRRTFYGKYSNVDFLIPLFECMTQADPALRPDASEALALWHHLRSNLTSYHRRWRLRPRVEVPVEMVIFETVALVRLLVFYGRWAFHKFVL